MMLKAYDLENMIRFRAWLVFYTGELSLMADDAYNWIADVDRSLWIQENALNAYEPLYFDADDTELLRRAL